MVTVGSEVYLKSGNMESEEHYIDVVVHNPRLTALNGGPVCLCFT